MKKLKIWVPYPRILYKMVGKDLKEGYRKNKILTHKWRINSRSIGNHDAPELFEPGGGSSNLCSFHTTPKYKLRLNENFLSSTRKTSSTWNIEKIHIAIRKKKTFWVLKKNLHNDHDSIKLVYFFWSLNNQNCSKWTFETKCRLRVKT